jgi:Arc/MetJ-type ribon-helix-helix transcriptional regulator
MVRGMVVGMPQIAIRLSEEDLARLDASVALGRYPSRAAAVRAGVERLLREERDREIADAYRRGYGPHPQEEELGLAGVSAMAALVRREEDAAGHGDG